MNTLFRPTVLYDSEVWGPSLLEFDLSSVERVQIILLCRIIRCKQIVPQPIILVEFGAHPFRLEIVFGLVSPMHRLQSFVDTAKGRDQYPYLA